jgi:hypothetical protein
MLMPLSAMFLLPLCGKSVGKDASSDARSAARMPRFPLASGGRNWARTSDLQLVELALSQLSYAPAVAEFSRSRRGLRRLSGLGGTGGYRSKRYGRRLIWIGHRARGSSAVSHQRGWKKRRNPTSAIAPATSTRPAEMPIMNIVNTPITTSGNPRPYAGPAAHGELFSGKE